MTFEQKIKQYVTDKKKILHINISSLQITKIGKGDYNMNYVIEADDKSFLFRLNIKSQSGLKNQIAYEYKTLEFLKPYHIAPSPIYLDDSKKYFPYGILIEKYIKGHELIFSVDSVKRVAKTFAKLHQIPLVDKDFLQWKNPLREQYSQAMNDLEAYKKRKIKNNELITLGEIFLSKLEKNLTKFEQEYIPRSITHTDPNPANIIDDGKNIFLLDWEKARIDDPSYDIALFFSTLLNLWASPRVLTQDEKNAFLDTYIHETKDATIKHRIQNRLILYTLHGIFWAASRIADVDEGIISRDLGDKNYERYKKFADLTELKLLLQKDL